jgi:catechol 2,3-dioxygenase-like lactoylglutathione lyase family enzyme
MGGMRIHHVALQVKDCERSAQFYGGLLGLAVLKRHEEEGGALRAVWLAAGDAVLMIERTLRGRPRATGSRHLLCFEIEDLLQWEARLYGAGVKIDDRTQSTLYISDPDGHRVGLSVYRF